MNALRHRENNDDKRMELTEHLGELRTRLIRSIWYLVIGAVVAYQFFPFLYGLLYKPLEKEVAVLNHSRIQKELHAQDKDGDPFLLLPVALTDPPTKDDYVRLEKALIWLREHPTLTPLTSVVFHNFYEPFTVRITISVLFGFILVLPLVVWELAQFIMPALTLQERKPLRVLVPLSSFLLISGVAVAYATMFYAMGWFLGYLDDFPQGAVLMQDPNDYVIFLVKMMAAFGIAFQLPVVLMAFAYTGLVTSKGLIKNWRWGVLIAFLGGVLTPANDPMSWILMVVPLLILYFGSVFLVKYVERLKAKARPV